MEPIKSVSGADGLREALRTAKAGTTIELAGGDYGELHLSAPYGDPWSRFAGEVTVRSANPNDPATFSRMYLNGVENLTFDGIAVDYTSPKGLTGRQVYEDNAILVRDSANITIRNSVLEGDVIDAPGSAVDGTPAARSMFIRDSEGIVIEDNEISTWYRGALFHDDKDVVLRGNDVHTIRSDGFNFAAVQDVLIEDNYLHDFAVATDEGVHRDMIQMWSANTDTPSTGITIRGNHLNSGDGVWTQSIFMRNEAVDTGAAGREMFYKNIVVENNVIYNGHLHGITVGHADGVKITNNTLLHNPASGDDGGVSRPRITVEEEARNVHVELNIAQAVPEPSGNAAGWKVANNLLVQNRDPEKPNYYGDLFVDAMDAGGNLDALQALPGSIIHQGGYGSSLTRGGKPGGPVVSPESPESPEEPEAPAPANPPPPAQGPEPKPTPDPDSGGVSFDLAIAYDDGRLIDGDLTDGEVLALDDVDDGRVTLVATPSEGVGSVKLNLVGVREGVETTAPYVLFGDSGGDYHTGTRLGAGDYELVATAYSAGGGRGSVLGSETIAFSVADQPDSAPQPKPTAPGTGTGAGLTRLDFAAGDLPPDTRLVGNAAISKDGAVVLDGNGDYLALHEDGRPAFTGAASVAFDVRFDGAPQASETIRLLWEHAGYGVQLRGGKINASVGTDGGGMQWTESVDAGALFDGNWHRLALTVDSEADVLRFYIDGDLAIERTDLHIELSDSARPLTFGSAGWGDALEGEIDNILVADTVLDADLLA